MAISKLPEEVRSAVRNGTTIVSTAQCVAELVYNALDADADSIIIHLDMPQYKLQVFDNGSGMTFENLKNCGIRYNTSKCRSLSDIQSNLKFYGFRGEALAGIVASSGTVIILTRPKSDGHTFCKTFSNGKQHHPKRSITSRTCHGTTITVQNFMCNAPVRQQRIKPNIDVEEIRMQVEGLALAHPRVSFTIQDESDNSTILNVTRSQSTLETFSKLYGEEITSNLHPVGPLDSGKHKLYGFISKSSHHNKKLQFIFVNGKLVKRTKVHKLINMIMRKSDVLRGNGPWQELPMPERVRDFLWVSPTKKRDRYCVFLIKIDCPLTEYDITLDPEKTLIEFRDWDSLLEGTEKLVKDFLKRHNLAYVTSDPEIGESEEESPTSVLKEVRKLDEEDSVRDKLDRFKHDSAKQDETKTFTARTIRSIPAKRFISNQKKSNSSKNSKSPPKNVKQLGSRDKIVAARSKIPTTSAESPMKQHFRPSNSQSLGNKSSNAPLINTTENDRIENPECDTLANVDSSLSKFRKLFQNKDTVPLKTPADQIIKVLEPPPIVKRKNPLEHRIKALMEPEKIEISHSKIAITNNTVNGEHTKNEISQKKIPNKDSIPVKKPSDVNVNEKYFANALSNDNIGEESGYFKKIHATTSIATQTVSDFTSLEQMEQPNFKVNKSKKPNLRNICARIKLLNESLPVYSKSTTQNSDMKDGNQDNFLNKKRNQRVDFLTLGKLSIGQFSVESSKELPSEEGNHNFISSSDLIHALEEKSMRSKGETMTEIVKDIIAIPGAKNKTRSVTDTDIIYQLVPDTEKQEKVFDLRNVECNEEKMDSSLPAMDLSIQSAQKNLEIDRHNITVSQNDDAHQEKLSHSSYVFKDNNWDSAVDMCYESLPEKLPQSDIFELETPSINDCEMGQRESGYTSDNVYLVSPIADDKLYNIEVTKEDCVKAGRKRTSKNEEERKCVIKKAHFEINLDCNPYYSMDIDEFKSMKAVSHTFPYDPGVQEVAYNNEDVGFSKEKEIVENEIQVTEDLSPKDMNDVENNDISVCEKGQYEAEISVVVDNNTKESSFEMFARTPFLPKGLSPILAKDSAKCVTLGRNSYFKLPTSGNLCSVDSGKKVVKDDVSFPKKLLSDESCSENDTSKTGFIASYLSEMENKKYITECKVLSAYESSQNKSIMKIFNLIHPCTFSKKVIAKFKMLGRLDDKFIVAQIDMDESLTSGSLVLFDQHAVHERIRLEKLMKEYVIQNEEEGKSSSTCVKYKSVPIVPPLEITVTSSEIRIMRKFTGNFERLGLSFERCPGNDDKNEEVALRITSIPACLSSKDAKELGPLGLKERIRALIREQTEDLVATRGLGTFSPEVLRDAINMEACRGAVKFGDTLSDHQCRWLLRNLAKCDSPFQCAHGRPSMYPIAATSHLEKHWSVIDQEKPCLQRINQLIKP